MASRQPVPLPVIVPWPCNIAWRIKMTRYANLDPFLECRRNKAFAMPFHNWEAVYDKLTLKEPAKIKYMPTEVIVVPPDAMVGDMSYIDHAFMFIMKNDPLPAMRRRAEPMLDQYESTLRPYGAFVQDPMMFARPEILVERSAVTVLPFRVTTVPGPLVGKRRTLLLALVPIDKRL